ncbi:MAG: invasion associated locus B family protein [Nannocystaceae bacterium]|jgi:invasion protein IalB
MMCAGSRSAGALLLAASLLVGALPASAQEPSPDQFVEVYGDWTVRCNAAEGAAEGAAPVCVMQQQLSARAADGRQQNILNLVLTLVDDLPTFTAITPLGVDLGAGMGLSVGTLERTLAYRTCRPRGCVVRADLDGDTVAAFRAGDEALFVIPFVNGQTVNASVSLTGFSAAWARLSQL